LGTDQKESRAVSEKKRLHKRRKQYTFEEDTALVAQTIINIVETSTIDPHPVIVALLESSAQRIRTLYTLPAMPDSEKPPHA
jgi:hypothetical protein